MSWNIGLKDKIGSLSHSSGIITLAPSVITIGGRQYYTSTLQRTISSDVTLAANSLYFIYLLVSSGAVVLRVSQLVPSVYTSVNPSSVAVGSFYSNNSSQFGTISDVDGLLFKWQQKFLSASVTFNTTLGDLTFNNLVIGKTYRVYLYVILGDSSGPDSQLNLNIFNGATFIAGANHTSDAATGISNGGYGITSRPFVATATTVTFVSTGLGGTDSIFGNGGADATNAILEELPSHIPVSIWT